MPQLDTHLSNCFQKRQGLNISNGTTDFDHAISALQLPPDPTLDFIGDVREYLHSSTEVVATAFLAMHVFVDSTGREIVRLAGLIRTKALVIVPRSRSVSAPSFVTNTSPC